MRYIQDGNLQQTVADMKRLLVKEGFHCVGAPDVHVQMASVYMGGRGGVLHAPVITDTSADLIVVSERPHRCANGREPREASVGRPVWVRVSYLDENGTRHERSFRELDAACLVANIESFEGRNHHGCR